MSLKFGPYHITLFSPWFRLKATGALVENQCTAMTEIYTVVKPADTSFSPDRKLNEHRGQYLCRASHQIIKFSPCMTCNFLFKFYEKR